jgi:leucyl-tRNA---protein transferase
MARLFPQEPAHEVPLRSFPSPCPYLPGETALLPFRLPTRILDPQAFDRLLSQGDRRSGRALYRPSCTECSACQPIRVAVPDFVPSPSQRRVERRNRGQITVEMGVPRYDPAYVRLYDRHKMERGLSSDQIGGASATSPEEWSAFFVKTCVRSVQMRYLAGSELIGVGIVDLGATSSSSVYFFFDPDAGWRSPGVYSMLAEIALARRLGMRWHYLGLYVEDCRALSYKAAYHPHERLIGGRWIRFEKNTSV